MGDAHTPTALRPEDAALAPPPDAENPALIDAGHTFIGVLIGAGLFVGAVVAFIL